MSDEIRKKLPVPVSADADEQTALKQVVNYYHETIKQTVEPLDFLKSRGLVHSELIDTFQIGYANRTLGLRIPNKRIKAGAQIRKQLTELGVYRDTGREHFAGSITVPVLNVDGQIVQIYGRKVRDDLRPGTEYHLNLPNRHHGIFNPACLGSRQVIIAKSMLDALTFWVHGFRHVTSQYSDELLAQLVARKTERVYFACEKGFDLSNYVEQLEPYGIECFRIDFPLDMDANAFALRSIPAEKTLLALINSAHWLGKGKPAVSFIEASPSDRTPSREVAVATVSPELTFTGEDVSLSIAERNYRIRGLMKNTSYEVLKVNLKVQVGDFFHLDNIDLYQASHRKRFIKDAAGEVQQKPELLKQDLGKLLLQLEDYQEERIRELLEPKKVEVVIEADDRAEAMELLKAPDLLDRILADFDRCGVVGEKTNKLVGYIASISRKLDKPLGVMIQSMSAAGKTAMMKAILAFVPEEERIEYSAMTSQSLYYLGESELKNKILAIAEEEGASKASYALKLLQSEGELMIASTGKDDMGRMGTQSYRVEGPTMLFLTTTAIDIDEELMNRCLILTVDESREQTERIHKRQRKSRTLEGLKFEQERKAVLHLQRNAQRLLRRIAVRNPFAEQLTFRCDQTRTRRDHEKYLTLIDSIALLHQHQRPLKRDGDFEYIEVTIDDIASANSLAHEVLGRSLDELPPQTRRLLGLIHEMVTKACQEQEIEMSEYRFTRRSLRHYVGWSEYQVRVHLSRLASLEYVMSHSGGRGKNFVYELLFDGDINSEKAQLMKLLEPSKLKKCTYDSKFEGLKESNEGALSPQSGSNEVPSSIDEKSVSSEENQSETDLGSTESENEQAKAKNKSEVIEEGGNDEATEA